MPVESLPTWRNRLFFILNLVALAACAKVLFVSHELEKMKSITFTYKIALSSSRARSTSPSACRTKALRCPSMRTRSTFSTHTTKYGAIWRVIAETRPLTFDCGAWSCKTCGWLRVRLRFARQWRSIREGTVCRSQCPFLWTLTNVRYCVRKHYISSLGH